MTGSNRRLGSLRIVQILIPKHLRNNKLELAHAISAVQPVKYEQRRHNMSRKDLLQRRAERQEKRRLRILKELGDGSGPAIVRKARKYSSAVAKWIKAGRPVRSEEEATAIYEGICCPCDDFDESQQTCSLCRCVLKPGGALLMILTPILGEKAANGLLAKTYMETEHCDKGKW